MEHRLWEDERVMYTITLGLKTLSYLLFELLCLNSYLYVLLLELTINYSLKK
jgi:hypothetical protein